MSPRGENDVSLMDKQVTSNKERAKKWRAQLVMHVTSEDHRMNVTGSEKGKYHQRSETMEMELTDRFVADERTVTSQVEGFYKFSSHVSSDLP